MSTPCTDYSARWCPNCDTCTCPARELDDSAYAPECRNKTCPLHGENSKHAAPWVVEDPDRIGEILTLVRGLHADRRRTQAETEIVNTLRVELDAWKETSRSLDALNHRMEGQRDAARAEALRMTDLRDSALAELNAYKKQAEEEHAIILRELSDLRDRMRADARGSLYVERGYEPSSTKRRRADGAFSAHGVL
jgi:hypothetical protein